MRSVGMVLATCLVGCSVGSAGTSGAPDPSAQMDADVALSRSSADGSGSSDAGAAHPDVDALAANVRYVDGGTDSSSADAADTARSDAAPQSSMDASEDRWTVTVDAEPSAESGSDADSGALECSAWTGYASGQQQCCVSGRFVLGTDPAAPDGTVTDLQTGLVWYRYAWIGGPDGVGADCTAPFTLPSYDQLATLVVGPATTVNGVEYENCNPSIDQQAFPNFPIGVLQTSGLPDASPIDCIDFDTGLASSCDFIAAFTCVLAAP